MSYLSDFVRATTGGLGIGETVGATVGGIFGPGGAATGARIGGSVTEFIDFAGGEGQATARDVPQRLPAETSMSGQQVYSGPQMMSVAPPVYGAPTQAFGGFGVGSLQAARQALGRVSPGTAGAVGTVVGAAADFILDQFGQPKKLVITRKMKRDVMDLYNYMGGDLNRVAQAYSQYKGMNFSAAQIQKILLKRFRNDGAYVTKAAVRKTRSTVRKLERLEALKKQICGTRAAPRRRAAARTSITQVK